MLPSSSERGTALHTDYVKISEGHTYLSSHILGNCPFASKTEFASKITAFTNLFPSNSFALRSLFHFCLAFEMILLRFLYSACKLSLIVR